LTDSILYTTVPYVYPIAAMADYIPELPAIQSNNGGPWLWQVCNFEEDCLTVLREIRGLRLQSGRYPTPQEHIAACSCDASALLEIVEKWGAHWQVPYAVMRLAARGLYVHPDVEHLTVMGVPVADFLAEVQHLVSQRGYALGLLDAALCGRYEAPWDRVDPHPLSALQALSDEVDAMAKAILGEILDEP
jgi:hypothetical protein